MRCFINSASLFGLICSLTFLGMSQMAIAGSVPTVLTNPHPSAFNYYYGTSTAITPDGSIAIVGANAGGYGLDTPPAVYLFENTNGVWGSTPIISLCDPAAASGCQGDAVPVSSFGSAVAVTAVNNNSFTVAVGSPGGGMVNGSPVSYGVVYIYQCALGTTPSCTSPVALADPGLLGADQFGSALAIAQDGGTLLVGAWGAKEPGGPGVTGNQANEGAVYVYTASSGTWNTPPAATLLDPAPTCAIFGTPPNQQTICDEFGHAVSLSGSSGSLIALIGAPGANRASEPAEGQAFIFNQGGSSWPTAATAVLTDPNIVACSDVVHLGCDEFGWALALSADGSTALVGAPNAVPSATPVFGEAGVANLYTQSGASWSGVSTPVFTFTNPNTQMNTIYTGSGGFGSSLALSNNGTALAVGTPEAAEGSNNGGYGGSGEVDEYSCSPACSNIPSNVLVDPPVAQNPATLTIDFFGAAVALSQDAGVLLAGAPQASSSANGGTRNNGTAYVYGVPAGQTPVALSLSVIGPNNVSVSPGEFLDYALTITNTSSSAAALDVTLTATLAPGVNLVGDTSGGAVCTAKGNTYSCTIASLAAGASWQPTITLSIASSDSGIIITVASLTVTAKNGGNSPSATEIVTVSSTATTLSLYYQPLFSGLIAGLSGGCSFVNGQYIDCSSETVCTNAPGSNCPMLIEVRNNSSTPADNVGLVITIPAGMTVSNVNAGQGSCFIFAGSGSGGSLWCGLGTLAPKSVWVVWYYYLVNSSDTNGQAENSEATAAATNMGSVSQPYNLTVGTPTTVVSTRTNSGSVSPLEIALLFGLAWCVRRRLRKQL